MKIYICDDDLNMLYMLKTWLVEYMEDREYQIQIYDNGIDMIYEVEHSDSQEPQIIFMDIKLKNDNGIDVAKVIKRLNQNAVIIFISGYTEYFEDSFEADPVYFLIKPLKKDVFEKAMGKALNKISKKIISFYCFGKKMYPESFWMKSIMWKVKGEKYISIASREKRSIMTNWIYWKNSWKVIL